LFAFEFGKSAPIRAGCIIIKDMSSKENIVTDNLLFNFNLSQFELFKVINKVFTVYCNLEKINYHKQDYKEDKLNYFHAT